MRNAGFEWTIEKGNADAGEQWEVTAPEHAKAKPYKMNAVLYNFTNLKATQFAGAGPAVLKDHELENPQRVVALFDGNGKELGRVAIGKASTGGQAVTSNVRPDVAMVEKARIDEIPWALADYKEDAPKPDAGTAPVPVHGPKGK